MIRYFSTLSILIILLLSFSCRKRTDSSYELIGKWHACEQTSRNFIITADGTGGYDSGDSSWNPPANEEVKANGNSFKIGSKRFQILVQPTPFDSATDWVGCVSTAFAPGNLPLKKMKLRSGNFAEWFYLRRP